MVSESRWASAAPREQRALYSDHEQHADHGLPELVTPTFSNSDEVVVSGYIGTGGRLNALPQHGIELHRRCRDRSTATLTMRREESGDI